MSNFIYSTRSTSEQFQDNARYCLTRLALRKANQWHPVSSLESYKKEVAAEGLENAILDLCLPINALMKESVLIKAEELDISIKQEEPEGPDIIDLTMDSDDEDVKPNIAVTPLKWEVFGNNWSNKAGPSSVPVQDPIQALLHSDTSIMELDFFCQDESTMTTREILGRLVKEKLLNLAKNFCKLKPNLKVC